MHGPDYGKRRQEGRSFSEIHARPDTQKLFKNVRCSIALKNSRLQRQPVPLTGSNGQVLRFAESSAEVLEQNRTINYVNSERWTAAMLTNEKKTEKKRGGRRRRGRKTQSSHIQNTRFTRIFLRSCVISFSVFPPFPAYEKFLANAGNPRDQET